MSQNSESINERAPGSSNTTDFKKSLQAFYEHRVREINLKLKKEAERIAAELARKAEEEAGNLPPSRKTSFSQLYSENEYKNAEEPERYTLIGFPKKKKSIQSPNVCLFPLPVPPVQPKKKKTKLEREADL